MLTGVSVGGPIFGQHSLARNVLAGNPKPSAEVVAASIVHKRAAKAAAVPPTPAAPVTAACGVTTGDEAVILSVQLTKVDAVQKGDRSREHLPVG